ncbi:hypothetical protein LEP1GSC061_0223 [Leptospira wolffii serovar Khorat str. Khorat-H2]|nr:hypothetical protein LEP1GSC061_0223 [Leptospira wolffii serovar Khorat str. Khorat-H2]
MTDLLGSPEKSDASFRKFAEEGQKGLLLNGLLCKGSENRAGR